MTHTAFAKIFRALAWIVLSTPLLCPAAIWGQAATDSGKINFFYVDGVTYTTCQAAIDAASPNGGIVVIPYNFRGNCAMSSQPSNVWVEDYRGGGVTIRSTASGNSTGQSPGFYAIIGPLGFCSNNPGPNNVVAITACAMSEGEAIWTFNPSVQLDANVPDNEINVMEGDIAVNPGGKYPRRDPYTGIKMVSFGPIQPTTAFYASGFAGTAAWVNGFQCFNNGVDFCYTILGGSQGPDTNGGYKTTQAVKSRGSSQCVSTDYKGGTNLNLNQGAYISVDDGPNQEDVQISGISGTKVCGGFRKNHSTGTLFHAYADSYHWLPSPTAVSKNPGYYLGSIQQYVNYHASSPLGWQVSGPTGTLQNYDVFQATGQRLYTDVGSGGWAWLNTAQTFTIETLDDSGALAVNSLNQANAGGRQYAGTCVFSASTTCSVTYTTGQYNRTPVVILTPVNPGSVTFTLTRSSNTGFTITASSPNSFTVNWLAVGNPN
jgi:hypothetical protein